MFRIEANYIDLVILTEIITLKSVQHQYEKNNK